MRKVVALSFSIFYPRGDYFLDQLPHFTAILVIFDNAHLAAIVHALEAVDKVIELEYIMAFTKNKPAVDISRDAFAFAAESRDRDDDVIRADQDGERGELQRLAKFHHKRSRCIGSREHYGAVAEDKPVEGRISLRANVETGNNNNILIRITLPDFGEVCKKLTFAH